MYLEDFEKLEKVRKIPFCPGKGGLLKKLQGRQDLSLQELVESRCLECQNFYEGQARSDRDCGNSSCELYCLMPFNKNKVWFNRIRFVHGVLVEMTSAARSELKDTERAEKLRAAGERIEEIRKEAYHD